MKTPLRFIALIPSLALLGANHLSADDLPARLKFDRYSGMLDRSPFAVSTAGPVVAATPNFAKDLYVANAARTPGADLVTVQSSGDKALKEYLSTEGPNKNGYSISNIEWSDLPGATKVTISKEGQFATLTFNQALLAQGPPSTMPGPPGVVQPNNVPNPNPQPYVPPKQPNVPGYPTPPPHVRGVIQRNPTAPLPRPSTADQTAVEQ